MSLIDWFVLILTLISVIAYGIIKSRGAKSIDHYFKSSNSLNWLLVLVSIMGTQASAITFLSAPGQAYTDGMRFVQYYFGLPFAMIVLCYTFVPIYHKLKVITAYEFLEQRFDLKTRSLTSALFLLQRGLSTGISIYAPSIILSSLFGWNIYFTNAVMGGVLIIYTVAGGARAVAYTQLQQMIVIFAGMLLAGYMIVHLLPKEIKFVDAIHVAGSLGRMNVIETRIDVTDPVWWKDKYNIWSGLIGGFFLALSYFGTDQSQVGRYLTARNLNTSRIGLLLNGLIKVPMQFMMLLTGVLLFSFYTFYQSPVFFNTSETDQMLKSVNGNHYQLLVHQYDSVNLLKSVQAKELAKAVELNRTAVSQSCKNNLIKNLTVSDSLRREAKKLLSETFPSSDTNDTNYIFLYFIVHHLPKGLVGLLIAMIFLAAWGSIAAALNSLASTTVVDFYQRLWVKNQTEIHYWKVAQWVTFAWGLFSIIIAMFASRMGSLIEAVNVLGSLFYGTILGIFVVAFYLKKFSANAVFIAAIVSEILVIGVYLSDLISFLWLNVLGCLLVILISSMHTFLKLFTKKV